MEQGIKASGPNSPLSTMGISSIKRRSTGYCFVNSASAGISSSLKPPISTAFSLIFSKPASSAASRPFQAISSEPQREIAAYFLLSSVSRLMFTRRTPASFKGRASSGRSVPLVVMQSSWIPSRAAASAQSSTMSRRTRGSPPVIRSLRMPSPAAASIARSSSSRLSSSGQFATPSAGMQYRQRRLQRSVTDTRRYVIVRP